MKVTNWCRKMIATIVAGGALLPGLAHAVSVTVGDPSFETYTVSPSLNYAYATGAYGAYRPTSPWVDDLNSPRSPSGNLYIEDDDQSNWMYNSTYAELGGSSGHFRGAPRTGGQAMHGAANYNAQVLSTTFAAEKYYTYSVWAQGDADAVAADDSVYLYMFNGNTPFSEANSLTFKGFQGGPTGDFANRGPTMTAAQSKANWKQITITRVVYPDSPEVGKPIGLGFYMHRDAAIDDVTLDADDASNHLMVLEVNTTNGQVRIRNQTPGAIKIDYYDIKSTSGALNSVTWSSLQAQNLAGFPGGNGSGNGWEKAGGSSSTAIGESYLTGNSSVGNSTNVGLGAAFNVGGTHDLYFEYSAILSATQNPTGDYNNNGVVDAADYAVWRKSLNQNVTLPNDSTPGTVTQADFDVWRANFGATGTIPPSTLLRGLVHYVTSFSGSSLDGSSVPEPTSVLLAGLGFVTALIGGQRKR
jgi:hypothetical protein